MSWIFVCSLEEMPKHVSQLRPGRLLSLLPSQDQPFSSGAAVRTGFLNIPYGVSKAGLDRLTLGLGEELKAYGIACVSLSPSASATDTVRRMYPDQNIEAWTQPPEVAARALRALLEDDPMQYTGKVLSVREYLAHQEAE